MENSARVIASYKAEVPWEQKDLYNKSIELKKSLFKGVIDMPTGRLAIWTDDKSVFRNMRLRNFQVQEGNTMTGDIQGELFFVKNSTAHPNSIAYRDDENKIGVIYGNVFEPGVVTGFASHIYAREKNIANPVFVHGSLIKIANAKGIEKNILLAGAHGSGKSYATFSIMNYIKKLRKYPKPHVSCTGDDRYILRKDEDAIYGLTTDPSITLDRNILQKKTFSDVLKRSEEEIAKAILANGEIKKYFEDHFYKIEKWFKLDPKKRKGAVIHALEKILKDTSGNTKQLNIFDNREDLVKKISFPAATVSKEINISSTHEHHETKIDHIIVLYPNETVKEVLNINDMANIIAQGATNHYPSTREELPGLVDYTKNILELLKDNTHIYNYKQGDDLNNILDKIFTKKKESQR